MSLFNLRGSEGQVTERRDTNGIHNPFENPTVPLTAIGLDNVYGMLNKSDAGESVTLDTVSAIPTYWRCVSLMSTIIAGCPLRAYKREGKKEVFPDILSTTNENMRYTQFELWELVIAHLMTWGNAFVLKYRDPTVGRNATVPPSMRTITDLRPIDPARVSVKFDAKTKEKIFEITKIAENGVEIVNGPPIILTTYEVMHIAGLGFDGVQGVGPVSNFIRTLGTSIAADKLAARFYSAGTMLSGIVQVRAPLTSQEQADAIRSRWIQKSGGVAHGGDVAVLDADTTFVPLTIPPDQLQFLESRRWQTTEIARMFGIPPHLVGDVEKTTSWGTGIEQQNIAFCSYTVSSYTNRVEQRVSREVIPMSTQFCEFDLNRLMRGAMQERFTAYNTAINSGWLTRNEARDLENMEPLPHLDDPLVAINMETVAQQAAAAKAGVQPGMPPGTPPAPPQNTEPGPQDGDNSPDGSDTGNSSMAE